MKRILWACALPWVGSCATASPPTQTLSIYVLAMKSNPGPLPEGWFATLVSALERIDGVLPGSIRSIRDNKGIQTVVVAFDPARISRLELERKIREGWDIVDIPAPGR